MANRLKIKGTSEKSFEIGLTNKFALDANNLTANRTWVLPDSNGTAGYVLSTDGTGNLSWAAGGSISSQARLQFTAASSGTGQTFTDVAIATFTNNTYANVFVNGVLLQTSEYSISGTTLTVSRYLSTGDNVVIGPTAAGGTPTGAQGTSWTAAGSIAVGDIFTGTVAGPVSPGATYTASTSSNTNFTTWMPTDMPVQSPNLRKIIWDGTQYVACGAYKIYTSTNGYDWTTIYDNTSREWTSIAYGAGIYVATSGSVIYSSTDLVTWTSRLTSGVYAYADQLIFANGKFIAVDQTNGVYYSTNGTSWTNSYSNPTYIVGWDGTYYQIIGNDNISDNLINRSTDGITWTLSYQNTATLVAPESITTLANGTTFAIGCSTSIPTTVYFKTTNGTTWTEGTLSENIFACTSISNTIVGTGAWPTGSSPSNSNIGGNGQNLTQTIWSSSNGTTWNKLIETNEFGTFVASNFNYFYSDTIDYANGKLFMAVGNALYVGIADNMIYVGNTGTTAPAGTYRCLGSVNPDLPTYLWVRLS